MPEAAVPQGHEVINGELIEKQTSGEHGYAQAGLCGFLSGPFGRRSSGGPPERPGGWWLETEVLIEFGGPKQRLRPDLAGWRRDKVPARPTGSPIATLPDWICEVISPGNASNDTVKKLSVYQRHQVGHYWLLDPRDETLTVLRWGPQGYILLLSAGRGDKVRAEPFDAIELPVGVLFGDDEE